MDSTISSIVTTLNSFLNDEVSPHTVSLKFDDLAPLLKANNIQIILRPTSRYSLNQELNKLIRIGQSPETTIEKQYELWLQEKEIIKQSKDELIRFDPQHFLYDKPFIIAYLGGGNGSLLTDLIKSYKLEATL